MPKNVFVIFWFNYCSGFFSANFSYSKDPPSFLKGKKGKNTNLCLSYDVASGSEITPCNKICKPLVVYRLTGNVMTLITTLRS